MKTTFKRLDVGRNFTSNQNGSKGLSFRKISGTKAVRLDERGRGNTAQPVTISRSHAIIA